MPPQSRGATPRQGPVPNGFQSKSTPNLPTLRTLRAAERSCETTNNPIPAKHGPVAQPADINGVAPPSEAASSGRSSVDTSQEPSLLLSGASDDDVESDEEEQGHVPSLPVRPMNYHHHSRSHTHLGSSAFAPPFYNRPPTPLPPSPSLTSLLRPNFSSQNSRPTTPDPSSDEGAPHRKDATGTQTPNSAAASTLTSTYRTARTIPRASPKVPTYEYYGFTLYLTSSLAFIVYLLWAFLPSPFLHQLGIYYYPNRWWALAIPAWTVMLVVYIYVALASYNVGYLTVPLTSVECFVDGAAQVAIVDEKGRIIRNDRPSWRSASPERMGISRQNGNGGRQRLARLGRGGYGGHSRQGSFGKTPIEQDLDWRKLWTEGTDAVMDIPVGGVCEILYGGVDTDEDDNDLYE